MKAKLVSAIVFCVVVMSLTLGADAQGVAATVGQIKAVRVVGDVKVVHAANPTAAALSNNDAVAQGDVIITAKQSSVVLVFSNGSTMSLGQDSKLAVDEFLQDPFAEEGKVAETKEEPSTSHTKLALTYGELVGHVRKLKGESTFLVQTPVGAAGIRGTTFRIVYRPSGEGKAFFSLSTASGEVVFQGTTGTPIPVPADQEVVLDVKIDSTTGAVLSVEVTTQNISSDAKQVIEQQTSAALDAMKDASFTPTTTTVSPQSPLPEQPQQELPRTTPGGGQPG